MKTNAKELFEVIRLVVRDELKKSLPGLVREHLAESYIKKVVVETTPRGKNSKLAELLTVDNELEEDTPEPQENNDKGIYNDASSNMIKKESSGVKKLVKNLGPLSFVLEGVKIPGEEGEIPDVPLDNIAPEFEKMNRLVEAMDKKLVSNKEMSTSAEAKMRELQMKRDALEVPVGKLK